MGFAAQWAGLAIRMTMPRPKAFMKTLKNEEVYLVAMWGGLGRCVKANSPKPERFAGPCSEAA
jgi:hypothetical protein